MVEIGIDLREYYPSVEWDILGVPAERHEKYYPCCAEPYPDIFFNITLRRKTLFYTVNLIIPWYMFFYLLNNLYLKLLLAWQVLHDNIELLKSLKFFH